MLLVFLTAYAIRSRVAPCSTRTRSRSSCRRVSTCSGTATAHQLPQLISIPSYLVLVIGALWSAWRMRGRPELKDRFMGTLLIVLGATIIAGFGSAFAALGDLAPFSVALLVGISVMFWGFLRASMPVTVPAAETATDAH